MVRVSSDLSAAQEAVSGFHADEQTGRQETLSESTIEAMYQALSASNQMLGGMSTLKSNIKTQADKIPELAALIEARDKLDAIEISKMNWGF
ncbi:hypothetical protein [Lactovum odontotermitis]